MCYNGDIKESVHMLDPLLPKKLPEDRSIQLTSRAAQQRSEIEEKVNRLGKCFIGQEVVKTRTFKVAVFSAVALTLAVLMLHPAGWALAIPITAVALSVGIGGCMDTFSIAAAGRLLKIRGDNQNEIKNKSSHKLLLGALPNQFSNDLNINTLNDQGVKTVVSINEPWEREPRAFSLPITREEYASNDINYATIESIDHELLSVKDLENAADMINAGLEKGAVYVHCRAGRGRSSMAIAAYLIKHENKSLEQAEDIILSGRPNASIKKKRGDGEETGMVAFFNKYMPECVAADTKRLLSSQPLKSSMKQQSNVARVQNKVTWKDKALAEVRPFDGNFPPFLLNRGTEAS